MLSICTPSHITYGHLMSRIHDMWAECGACHNHARRRWYESLWDACLPNTTRVEDAIPVKGHCGWFGSNELMPIDTLLFEVEVLVEECGATINTGVCSGFCNCSYKHADRQRSRLLRNVS